MVLVRRDESGPEDNNPRAVIAPLGASNDLL
jgi:hypothetical protein